MNPAAPPLTTSAPTMNSPRSRPPRVLAALLVLGATLPGPVPARPGETPGPTAVVAVDTSVRPRAYSRLLFGGFLEHFHRQIYGGIWEPGSPLSDARGFRTDVLAAVRELGTPVVRWPGGCFVSAYHWKDGVGANRQPSYDKAWGVEEPNAFGTDEFVAWCRLAGTEPYICGNAGTGTPEEMSDWVEYCNQTCGRWARLRAAGGNPEPFRVRYWSVGNENWGSHEIGAKTTQEWGLFVRETAKMIRRVDPAVVLSAAALGDDWNRNLLQHAGHSLDMLSIHGYWDGLWAVDQPAGYAECMMRSGQPEQAIVAVERLLAGTGHLGRITIAFDEWNLRGWHHPGLGTGFGPEQIAARDRNDRNATYTMADALFAAGFLNACLRHADTVSMANIAPLVNTRGPLFTHPGGLVKRTTFHVLHLYARQLGPRVARAAVSSDPFRHGNDSAPAVDAVATCDPARRHWRIAALNRHPAAPARCRVTFDGAPAAGLLEAVVLDGDSPDAFNDVDRPDRVIPRAATLPFTNGEVTLPPHALVLLSFTCTPAPETLLGNGDTEAAAEPDRPADWQPTRWGEGDGRATWSEDRARSGSRCLALDSTTGADCAWMQRVGVDPHTRYRLSGWIRAEGVTPGTGRGAFLNIQEVQSTLSQVVTGTAGWTRVEMVFDSGSRETVQVNCLLGGWGRSTGRAWFDDLRLEPMPPGS